ncbi:MAG TPA: hypothetical protein VFR23_07175 [Jiangellaceae bacterium]|nr:hypothetical protein [Jiangellaceae bacterium]
MPALGFVLPLLPGKTDDDREAMISCWRGHRREAFEASRSRHGITREAVWIQQTPTGDVAVVYVEADNLTAMFKGLATSEESFDQWFRASVRDVHGVALEDESPPPEQVLDFHSKD